MKLDLRTLRVMVAPLLLACSAEQADNPRLELSALGSTLHLPAAMQQALDAAAPGLRLVHTAEFRADVAQSAMLDGGHGLQPLFAVVRDFDGDGRADAVVEGARPGSSALEVIAIMNTRTPKAVEVTSFPQYDADAVGIYLSAPPDSTRGAFEVVNYPDATTVFAWHGDKFEPIEP